MVRRLWGIGVAVVAVAVAWYVLAPGAPPDPASERVSGPAERAETSPRRRFPGLAPRPFVRGATVVERAGVEAGSSARRPPVEPVEQAEARAALEAVLEQIDTMVAKKVVLDERGFNAWRNRANAAFAAFQTTVDASAPEGVQTLEQARAELVRRLRGLERRIRRDPRHPEWMDAVP